MTHTSVDRSFFSFDTSLSSRSTIPSSFAFSTSSCVWRCCSHSICRCSSISFFAACHVTQPFTMLMLCRKIRSQVNSKSVGGCLHPDACMHMRNNLPDYLSNPMLSINVFKCYLKSYLYITKFNLWFYSVTTRALQISTVIVLVINRPEATKRRTKMALIKHSATQLRLQALTSFCSWSFRLCSSFSFSSCSISIFLCSSFSLSSCSCNRRLCSSFSFSSCSCSNRLCSSFSFSNCWYRLSTVSTCGCSNPSLLAVCPPCSSLHASQLTYKLL